jgi:hypothetical protein
MQQHDGRGAGRAWDISDEHGAEAGQLQLAPGWQGRPETGTRTERQICGISGQSDSTLRTVIVSEPLGAS